MKSFKKILTVIIFLLLMLMFGLVSIQVSNRYITQISIPWTEELTRISYVLLIYVGSVLAVIQNNHVRITILEKRLPDFLRRLLWIGSSLLSALFFSVVAIGNYSYTQVNWDAKFPATTGLTIGYILLVVMVCSGLMAALYALNIFKPVPDDAEDAHGEQQ